MLQQTEKIRSWLAICRQNCWRDQLPKADAALVQLNALESILKSIKEKAITIAPDYPNIAESEPWEQLWAIQTSCEGTSAANDDCHKVIAALQRRLGMSREDLLTLWQEIGKEKR